MKDKATFVTIPKDAKGRAVEYRRERALAALGRAAVEERKAYHIYIRAQSDENWNLWQEKLEALFPAVAVYAKTMGVE